MHKVYTYIYIYTYFLYILKWFQMYRYIYIYVHIYIYIYLFFILYIDLLFAFIKARIWRENVVLARPPPVARINPKPRHLRGLERCRCHGGTTKTGEGAGSCAGASRFGFLRITKRDQEPERVCFWMVGLRPAWLPWKLNWEFVTMTALTQLIQFPILP